MPNCKNQAGEGHLQIVKRLSYEVPKPSMTVKPCMVPQRGTQGWAHQSNECPGPLRLSAAPSSGQEQRHWLLQLSTCVLDVSFSFSSRVAVEK